MDKLMAPPPLKVTFLQPLTTAEVGAISTPNQYPIWPDTDLGVIQYSLDGLTTVKSLADSDGNNAFGTWAIDINAPFLVQSDIVTTRQLNQEGTGILGYTIQNNTAAVAFSTLYRNDALGKNSAAANYLYAQTIVEQVNVTAGSESCRVEHFVSETGGDGLKVYLTINGDDKSVDIGPAKIRSTGEVVGSAYTPCRTMRVIADATIVIGDLLTASTTTDFRVVPILLGDPDTVPVIGTSLSAGFIGDEIEICGASLLPVRSDTISTISPGDPIEKSDTTSGAVQNSLISVGTFGTAAQSAGVSTMFTCWAALNENF